MEISIQQLNRKSKSDKLLSDYGKRLKQAIAEFYSQVTEDETKNQETFETCNLNWKKTAQIANSTQKHTTIDPFAFQKQIEEFKQIALENAIKQQENGTQDNLPKLRIER